MDEETMLDLLAEYSGSWKDRQYYEHIVREIQKKQHLSQLIQEHNHDPRDQLMLEASKRKTVLEIEKKFQQSTINSTYTFPRNLQKRSSAPGAGSFTIEDALPDNDSYNTSLDVDFYNLKAQNTKKKKTIQKGNQNPEQSSKALNTLTTSSQNIKLNMNNSQLSQESNSLSPISRTQQQQSAAPSSVPNKAILVGANSSVQKGGDQQSKLLNSNVHHHANNENLIRSQQRDEPDEKNAKGIKENLNKSQEKNSNQFHGNGNQQPFISNINIYSGNNNIHSHQTNEMVISPNKIATKNGVGNKNTGTQNQQQQQQQQTQQQQQQQYQKTFLQNQIIKQQQQAILMRTSQEDPQSQPKPKQDKNNNQVQMDNQQDLSDSAVGTRLNTCTNDVERDPDILSKTQKQTKSQSNSPISKVNGQQQSINNYYYLSNQSNQPVTLQQNQQQQQRTSHSTSQNTQIKSNINLLNQNQSVQQHQQQQVQQPYHHQQQPAKSNSSKNFNNAQQTQHNDYSQSPQINKNTQPASQQFKSPISKGTAAGAQTVMNANGSVNSNPQSISKNINLSQGNGKEMSNTKQVGTTSVQPKEIIKHSNAIESILYRQQQQHYTAGGLMQPHQILNTQESANANEDSTLSLRQQIQQSAKSHQQVQNVDSEQQIILKQLHNQNQSNIYNSKKLYQLSSNQTNASSNNNYSSQQSLQNHISQQQQQQQQNLQNVTHNKQRKLVQQNGTQPHNGIQTVQLQQQFSNSSQTQQNHSPFTSQSQQNIMMQNNSHLQQLPSSDQISSNTNLERSNNQLLQNSQVPQPNIINGQVAYLNENVLSTQPYSDNQTSLNPAFLNSEDILSQNSMAIDTQRKSSVRSKRGGGPNGNQEEFDQRYISTANNQNTQQNNVQFSQTHSQFKNKWIDFKKINPQYKGSDRANGGAINQTQYEDNASNTAAGNYRNTFSSVSPNGHSSSQQNNTKKGSINNYLSLSSAINNHGNSPSLQGNSTNKNKQGLTTSISQSNHFQPNGAVSNQNVGQGSQTKTMSSTQNPNQSSHLATAHISQHLQNQNSQELAAYQIKSGKFGLTDNSSVDKNYHTQFINNAKQQYQQQQFLLQQSQAFEEPNSNSGLSTKNLQRKQINKVSSCKSFEIRDKFNKTTSKNNANNVIINLSNVNTSNTAHNHNLYVQNLNHTTGNHNMSTINNNNMSNLNSQTIPLSSNTQSTLTVNSIINNSNTNNNNNSSQIKSNQMSSSQNIISYLPTSQSKNTYSAALYQKSQNNILSKQAKNPGESSMSNLFNNMHTSSSNNMLSNSVIAAASGQNGVNSSINLVRNTSQNPPSGAVTSSINNMNLNSYLTNHNQNSNTKLAKKIDMYKVFNQTNSNSFTNQKEQQSSVKQVKNLGLVLQKIIKNKTLKINEKSNQLNQQIQMANSQIQSNIAASNPTNQATAASKKQSTPGKKKMSTSGQPPNSTINNSTLKSPQFSSQLKKNYI